jgi:hypothetical protein
MPALDLPRIYDSNTYERVAQMQRVALVAKSRLTPEDTVNRVLLEAALSSAVADTQDEAAVKRFAERLPSDLVVILDKSI